MIEASATEEAPWGHVCGFPTNRGTFGLLDANLYDAAADTRSIGDLYGGAHYTQSASADLTPQGRAIVAAAQRFGDGATLPFTPCKKGFIPVVNGRRMYACFHHDRFRRKRVAKENGVFRDGEADLNELWQREELRLAKNELINKSREADAGT